jgi:hypothetical protein
VIFREYKIAGTGDTKIPLGIFCADPPMAKNKKENKEEKY